jgi:hypothetical protein
LAAIDFVRLHTHEHVGFVNRLTFCSQAEADLLQLAAALVFAVIDALPAAQDDVDRQGQQQVHQVLVRLFHGTPSMQGYPAVSGQLTGVGVSAGVPQMADRVDHDDTVDVGVEGAHGREHVGDAPRMQHLEVERLGVGRSLGHRLGVEGRAHLGVTESNAAALPAGQVLGQKECAENVFPEPAGPYNAIFKAALSSVGF